MSEPNSLSAEEEQRQQQQRNDQRVRELLEREYTPGELFDTPQPILIAGFVQGPNGKQELKWNEGVLRRILESDMCSSKKFVVLGPTGNARQGKSFRQNELLKYLQILEKETHKAQRPNLSDIQFYEGNTETDLFLPLANGFEWGTGDRTITSGIWIWSRPFLLMNCDRTEIAVIVLDTEGLNDDHGGGDFDATVDAQIFSMTALFSSVLTFYMRDADINLDSLVSFMKYGRVVQKGSPFQSLWLVVLEYQNGPSGLYMQKLEKLKKKKEYKELLTSNEVKCYALPFPGDALKDYEKDNDLKNGRCTLKDVNGTKNFLHYLGNLFKEILPMDSGARIQEHVLKRKKINGGWEYHTCRTFCAEVLSVFETFKQADLKHPDEFESYWACVSARKFAFHHLKSVIEGNKDMLSGYYIGLKDFNMMMRDAITETLLYYKIGHYAALHLDREPSENKNNNPEHFKHQAEKLLEEFKNLYESVQGDNEKKPKESWHSRFSSKEKSYATGGATGGGFGAAGGGAAVYYGIITAFSNPFSLAVGIGALGLLAGFGIVSLCLNKFLHSAEFHKKVDAEIKSSNFLDELYNYKIKREGDQLMISSGDRKNVSTLGPLKNTKIPEQVSQTAFENL